MIGKVTKARIHEFSSFLLSNFSFDELELIFSRAKSDPEFFEILAGRMLSALDDAIPAGKNSEEKPVD